MTDTRKCYRHIFISVILFITLIFIGCAYVLPDTSVRVPKRLEEQISDTLLITYVDDNGKVMPTYAGYSMIKRNLDEKGRPLFEIYLDSERQPFQISNGSYGIRYVYDDNLVCGFFYLDQNGTITRTKQGVSAIFISYDSNGDKLYEWFCDENGNKISDKNGCFGIKHTNNGTITVNAAGQMIISPSNLAVIFPAAPLVFALICCIVSVIMGKRFGKVIFVVSLLLILYSTLIIERNSINTDIDAVLFWSYKQFFSSLHIRREILNNMLISLTQQSR